MTVQQFFESEKIDKDFLYTSVQGRNSYSDNAVNFVTENWDRDIESLSVKQSHWLDTILDDCVEIRIEEKSK